MNNPSFAVRNIGFLESALFSAALKILYFVATIVPSFIVLVDSIVERLPFFLIVGRVAALFALSVLAVQVILGSRLKTLDRPFGLDRLLRLHRKMAIIALIAIIIHPLALAVEYSASGTLFSLGGMPLILGKIALFLLIVGIATAILRAKIKLDYNKWHLLHKGMILVVILGFAHSMAIGGNLEGGAMQLWWRLLGLTAIAVFIYNNIVLRIAFRKKMVVEEVVRETRDTNTLIMKPAGGCGFSYRPGQFAFLELRRPGRRSEEHPFTIASSPTAGDSISFTIKESGDFTRTIGETKPGDTARIIAPFGRFSLMHDQPFKMVFIAGGVGITPIMSMIRYLRDTADEREVVLLDANKSEEDIIFREEIESLPKNFSTTFILSAPSPEWRGEFGFVDSPVIEKYCASVLDTAHFYICGPEPMILSVLASLTEIGIQPKRLHTERFSLA